MRFTLLTLVPFVVLMLFSELHNNTASTLYQSFRLDLTEASSGTIRMASLNLLDYNRKGTECTVIYDFTPQIGSFHQLNQVSYLGEQHLPYDACDKYESGDHVTIDYDPKNPNHSALEITGLDWASFFDVVVILVGSLGIAISLELSGSGSGGDGSCGGGDGGD